jgi:hypothetical protein
MDRGDQRLLHDLDLVGKVAGHRVSALERLQRELGDATLRRLLPVRPGRLAEAGCPRRLAV